MTAAAGHILDEGAEHEHRARNRLHTAVLISGMAVLTAFSAWLLFGWLGVLGAAALISVLVVAAPRVPPEFVMRLFRAVPVDPRREPQLQAVVEELARRAELSAVPRIYVVPSATLNAFATGTEAHAAIAITEGLRRKLSTRELVGVLAHEISHIRNNDLQVMGLADILSRLTQTMSYAAVFLAIMYLPAMLTGSARVPWLAIFVLYFAPMIGSFLQLGLSRAREYDADLEGALMTGDPEGLMSALARLERYQGQVWEDLVPMGRRIPQPSVLRSHPTTDRRIARLKQLPQDPRFPPITVREDPMVSLAGLGPHTIRPRYRLPGIFWF